MNSSEICVSLVSGSSSTPTGATFCTAAGIVLTVEEHNIIGGLGGAVAEVLAEAGARCRFRRHGLPDEYALIGPPFALYAHYGLDAAGIVRQLRQLV